MAFGFTIDLVVMDMFALSVNTSSQLPPLRPHLQARSIAIHGVVSQCSNLALPLAQARRHLVVVD